MVHEADETNKNYDVKFRLLNRLHRKGQLLLEALLHTKDLKYNLKTLTRKEAKSIWNQEMAILHQLSKSNPNGHESGDEHHSQDNEEDSNDDDDDDNDDDDDDSEDDDASLLRPQEVYNQPSTPEKNRHLANLKRKMDECPIDSTEYKRAKKAVLEYELETLQQG